MKNWYLIENLGLGMIRDLFFGTEEELVNGIARVIVSDIEHSIDEHERHGMRRDQAIECLKDKSWWFKEKNWEVYDEVYELAHIYLLTSSGQKVRIKRTEREMRKQKIEIYKRYFNFGKGGD
jgi:hypothetical protein